MGDAELWTACEDALPEPATRVLTSCGGSWALGYTAGGEWTSGAGPMHVTHWMRLPTGRPGPLATGARPTTDRNSALGTRMREVARGVPPPSKLSLVWVPHPDIARGASFHIAFRRALAPAESWMRRTPWVGPDERLIGVRYWGPLPRLPGDPKGGFHSSSEIWPSGRAAVSKVAEQQRAARMRVLLPTELEGE